MQISNFLPPALKFLIAKSIFNLIKVVPQSLDFFYTLLGRNVLYYAFKSGKPEWNCIKSKKLRIFYFLQPVELEAHVVSVLDPEKFEEVAFEKVYGLSDGGKYSLYFDQLALYKFEDASLHPSSDFIRVGSRVYWDKLSKPQLPMISPGDSDLIAYDNNRALLIHKKPEKYIDCGFSLLGMKVDSWGHFVANCLPKFKALEEIDEPSLEILLPATVDMHIQEVTRQLAKKYGFTQITLVDTNSVVLCSKLYHCSMPSFLADNALVVHPSFAVVREFSKKSIHEFSKILSSREERYTNKKLFIARTTARNLENYKEIEDCFSSLGFSIIHPHEHSLAEKISMFQSATHIVGPGSSGFANMIFCQPNTKALIFNNFSRTLDLYFGIFSDKRYFNIDVTMLTGTDFEPGSPHSEFKIPLRKILSFMDETDFLAHHVRHPSTISKMELIS